MTGELLGIMANSTYCIVIHNFNAAATLAVWRQHARPEHRGNALPVPPSNHPVATQAAMKSENWAIFDAIIRGMRRIRRSAAAREGADVANHISTSSSRTAQAQETARGLKIRGSGIGSESQVEDLRTGVKPKQVRGSLDHHRLAVRLVQTRFQESKPDLEKERMRRLPRAWCSSRTRRDGQSGDGGKQPRQQTAIGLQRQ